jgi:hypothetical protein
VTVTLEELYKGTVKHVHVTNRCVGETPPCQGVEGGGGHRRF